MSSGCCLQTFPSHVQAMARINVRAIRTSKNMHVRIHGEGAEASPLLFENFVRQLDDESIWIGPLAQRLDMEQVFHLHAGLTVLAEDGLGSGGWGVTQL